MKNYKKHIAFAMALLLSLGSAALPAAFAEGEDDIAASDEADIMPIMSDEDAVPYVVDHGDEEDPDNPDGLIPDEEDEEEAEVIVSGKFSYIVLENGTAQLVGCSSAEDELTIPEELDGIAVAEIGAEGLVDVIATKITIPASIEYISEENPFARCQRLEDIIVDAANKEYCAVDGVLFTKDQKKLLCFPLRKRIDEYTVPEGVEVLGVAAFYDSRLKKLNLPTTLTAIQRHSLSFNADLSSIDMRNTAVQDIGVMAFVECTRLKEVYFSESTTNIDMGAFMECSALYKMELPSNLLNIGQNAFSGTALMKVRVPATVKEIGYEALGYDSNGKAVSGFLIVGENGSAAQIYATDYDADYDYKNNFDFITTAADDAAMEYAALNAIASGDYEYIIGDDGGACITYCNAADLNLIVPDTIDGYSVTSVYKNAFANTSATKLTLPETVKTIGENAFSTAVTSITLPGGLTDIYGDDTFLFATALREIKVTEGDGEYSSEDGVLYNKDKTMLLAYPASKDDLEFTVPKSVKEIGKNGFCYNCIITKADLSSVETINSYAFEGCQELSDVKLSKELKVVGENAFLGCSRMRSIRLYDKIEIIGDYAFGFDYDEELADQIAQNSDAYAAQGMETPLPFSVMENFKIYADKDTLGYQYANACGIQVVSGTVAIGSHNMDKTFVAVLLGAIAAIVLGFIGIITGKKISKSKKEKASEKRKENAKKKSENNAEKKPEKNSSEEDKK